MNDTPETNEAQADPAGLLNSTASPGSGHEHTSYRDAIVDRTGELLTSAVETAEKLNRPVVGVIQDPRDGTAAHIEIGKNGVTAVDPHVFDLYRAHPLRISGTAKLTTLDSFILHARRFALTESAVFACDDMTKPGVTTVFDYHPEGITEQARFGVHRAHYAFPLSPEWKAWHAANGNWMSMADFAAFIEERIVDVMADAAPESDAAKSFVSTTGGNMASPSKLIELSRGLQVYENAAFKEARNLSSGEGQLAFESQHVDADGKPLTVPNLFAICIPIFARASVFYQFLVRLRYRKSQGGIVFAYEIWRPELAFEQAFTEACDRVSHETGLPLFVGAPEA